MRSLVLLCLMASSLTLAGCVILGRSTYFEVVGVNEPSYDKMTDAYLFTLPNTELVVKCVAFTEKSLAIGPVVPVIPQVNRNSRLAYDIQGSPRIQITNRSATDTYQLVDLKSLFWTKERYLGTPSDIKKAGFHDGTVTVAPNETVWLVFPTGGEHRFTVKIGAREFTLTIRSFSKTRPHLVSV